LPYGVASSAIVGKIFGRIEPVLKYHTHKFVAHPGGKDSLIYGHFSVRVKEKCG